jgi:hypothetical protein
MFSLAQRRLAGGDDPDILAAVGSEFAVPRRAIGTNRSARGTPVVERPPGAHASNANRSAGRIAMGIVQFVGRSIWRDSTIGSGDSAGVATEPASPVSRHYCARFFQGLA